MIKTLVVIVVLQCIFLHYARGNDLAELDQNTPGNQDVTVEGGNRNGRILATYSKTTKDKTAEAVVKLDSLVSATSNVSAEIGKLGSSVNSSQSEKLEKLQMIETSLSKGGDLAKALKKVEATAADLLDALTNSSRKGTVIYELMTTYNIMETKLSNIEKIFGYDEHTTSTTTTVPTTTTTQSDPNYCSTAQDCVGSEVGPICLLNRCSSVCSNDQQCSVYGSNYVCDRSEMLCRPSFV